MKEPANSRSRRPRNRQRKQSYLSEYVRLLTEVGGVEPARVEAAMKELRALPADVRDAVAEGLVHSLQGKRVYRGSSQGISRALLTAEANSLQPPNRGPLHYAKLIESAGTLGYVFPGGFAGGFCFVPAKCIVDRKLDEARYVRSGWATRNVRLNPSKSIGSHPFRCRSHGR